MPPRPPRSRIVAIALRVLVVLVLIKFFVVDSVAVRTRSMDPTLPARANSPESVLIDRTAAWRDPGRFDVVVFRYPNHQSISYVKRVIGLPGEQIALRCGFAWMLPPSEVGDLESAWRAGTVKLLRKPRPLCDAFLSRLPVVDPLDLRGFTPSAFDRLCVVAPEARGRLKFTDDYALEISGQQATLIEWRKSPVDSLPDVAALLERREPSAQETGGENFVFGVAVGGVVTASTDAQAVLEIRLPDAIHRVRARIPVEGAMTIEIDGAVVATAPTLLMAGVPTLVRLDTCDATATLRVGDADVLSADLTIVPRESPRRVGAAAAFGSAGGTCRFTRPIFARDLYWRDDGLSRFEIPRDQIMVLGDHPAASADSRHWKRLYVRDLRDGSIFAGDVRTRHVGSDAEGPNPASNEDGTMEFTDITGDVHKAPMGTFEVVGSEITPFVPLKALRGRAFAIAWPLSHTSWIE